MMKTVKVKKQMRLDDLTKYIRDNRVREKTFRTDEHGNALSNTLKVDEDGLIETYFPNMHINNSFTVEVEEPITEDTEFDCILEIRKGSLTHIRRRKTIKENLTEETERFYALINGHLELVWEADGE